MKKLFLNVVILTAIVLGKESFAYDFKPGDVFLHSLIGSEVNVVRSSVIKSPTPVGALSLGVGADYVIDYNWGIGGEWRFNFSADFIDLSLSAVGKYWFTELKIPFVPYATVTLPISVLVPVTSYYAHWNFGLRPALGMQYFIMRSFSVGVEVGVCPSLMVAPSAVGFETSVDAELTFAWRL